MGIENILAEFDSEKRTSAESPEWKKLFNELCQEAIRLGMEMNNQYHTPEELREIIDDPEAFFKKTRNSQYVDERIRIAGTANQKIYMKGILQEVKDSNRTAIYGAGIRGKWMAERLLEKGISPSKLLFVVSHKGEDEEVSGIPVMEVGDLETMKDQLFVIVAVKGEAQIEMLANLQKLGIENVALADDEFRKLMQIQT